jgi:hypothetical protein
LETELRKKLVERFGAHRIHDIPVLENETPLLLLELESKSPVFVLMTNGLSDFRMQVPESLQGREYNELYFCLPSYWDWSDLENPNMNWIYPWIQRLTSYVVKNNSWFGHGHTMPCGKEMHSLSSTMLQNHFILSHPILLDEELTLIELNEKIIHFLAIIPIFPDEMDYKQGKGTFKLMQKLSQHGVNEKLDDYRSTVLKSKWRS